MSNIMKLTLDEVNLERPWDIVKKIEKIIRGEEKENRVKFKCINTAPSSWHFRFGGLSLEVYDINYKSVYRRVKVVFIKDKQKWEIDLDKIKEKYEEMKKLAQKFKEDRKKRDEYLKQNKELILNLTEGVENIRITGSKEFSFAVEICSLKEEEVKKVVEFVKTLKE